MDEANDEYAGMWVFYTLDDQKLMLTRLPWRNNKEPLGDFFFHLKSCRIAKIGIFSSRNDLCYLLFLFEFIYKYNKNNIIARNVIILF